MRGNNQHYSRYFCVSLHRFSETTTSSISFWTPLPSILHREDGRVVCMSSYEKYRRKNNKK